MTKMMYNSSMIKIKKGEYEKNMTVYLDMDGVIANFFKAFAKKNGVNHWKEIDDVEAKITELQQTDFFNTLEQYPTSKELVEFVKEVAGDDWGICSSPLRGDARNSAYWKEVWLKENDFTPPKKKNLVFTSNKAKWATSNGKPNILIDDKPSNIAEWEKNGGIGIRYQANEDSLAAVKKTLKQKKLSQ